MPLPSDTKLNTGVSIPLVGLGTWKSSPGQVAQAVSHALKNGYTHVDGAWVYKNEAEVGEGIRASGVDRSDIFLTGKVWNTYHTRPEACLDETLANLKLDYVDLLLLHWPRAFVPTEDGSTVPRLPNGDVALVPDWTVLDSWKEMEKILATGKAKAIGVSNFLISDLELILAHGSVVPAVNQVELHPYNPQHSLVSFCASKGIVIEAYSPLGSDNSPLLRDPDILAIAAAHSVSAATVLISYQVNRGVVVLPKSVTPSRIESNLEVIQLTKEDLDVLGSLYKTKHQRFVVPPWMDFNEDD